MIDVTVTVDDAHLPGIRAVAAALTDRGMHVGAVLPTLGVISGSCPEDRVPALGAVPGVVAVEQSRGFTATAPDDEGSTSTARPTEPPPAATEEDPGDGPLLEREPDGRYRVVDPRRPDDGPP